MISPGSDATDLVRRRVINVVGHELRTPVTTVRGLAELLVHVPEDEARDVIIPALVRNARRSEDLLDDLLVAGGVTTAHPVDDAAPVDLDAMVAEATAGTAVRVDGAAPSPVLGHRETITRALRHLVANADQYNDGGPVLHFLDAPDAVVIEIVTPVDHEVPDIELGFEVFFRGEAAVTRHPGIGIGLPVARALARLDGGDVEVEQGAGRFVTRLRLPESS